MECSKSKPLSSTCFVVLIFLCFISLCQTRVGFGRRKCARSRPATLFKRLRLLNGIECRGKAESQQNLKIPILSKKLVNNLSTVEDIEPYGYNVTTHTILSVDGYYSTVQRVFGGIRSPPKLRKQAVLLFHGLGGSGASWIIQPGRRNLAYLLADAGYEVWLVNGRGSTPSMKHVHLNPDKDISYWNFSFGEMGTIDLPLIVDLMLKETGTEKVYLVCHSLGCGAYLAGLSDSPELNKKSKAGFLLAPGAYFGGAYGALANLALLTVGTPSQQILLHLFQGRLSGERMDLLVKFDGLQPFMNICASFFSQCGICDKALFSLYGMDPPQLDFKNLPNILGKSFDNTVLNLFFHAGQNLITCGFNKFDYGRTENLQKYGSTQPPRYNLDGVTVPTYIFYGEYDNLLTPSDVKRTRDAIPPKYLRGFYQFDWPLFNHMDLMAKDADFLVYSKILKIMKTLDA